MTNDDEKDTAIHNKEKMHDREEEQIDDKK